MLSLVALWLVEQVRSIEQWFEMHGWDVFEAAEEPFALSRPEPAEGRGGAA